MTKVIDKENCVWFLFYFDFYNICNFYANLMCQSFWKIMHTWQDCMIIALLFVLWLLFYPVLCDDFNNKYFFSIIAFSGDYRDEYALIGIKFLLLKK